MEDLRDPQKAAGRRPLPGPGGPAWLSRLNVDSLQWLMGLFCGFIGAFLLVAPHEFHKPSYVVLRTHLAWWGAAILAGGLALLATAVIRPGRGLRLSAHALAGLTLVALAASFAYAGRWGGAASYGALGLALLAGGFLPGAAGPLPRATGDLYALALGIALAANGAVMLAVPQTFQLSSGQRPFLPFLGAGFLLGGPLVAWAQLRPLRPALRWAAHLLAGGTLIASGTLISWPNRTWTGIVLGWGCGAALAGLPWLRRRFAAVDPGALRTRLALALAVAASVALIGTVAVVSDQEERIATQQALETQRVEAEAIAGNIDDYVDLNAARTATIAALVMGAGVGSAGQRLLLDRILGVYSDVTGCAVVGLDGRLLGRTSGFDLPEGTVAGTVAELSVQRRPAVQVWLLGGPGRQHLLLGAPVRRPDGRLAGAVLMLLDSQALARRVQRAGSKVWLADGHGKVIAEAGRPARPLPPGWDREVAAGRRPGVAGRLVAFAEVSGLGWAVAVEQPPAAALAGARRGRQLAFLLLLLVAGLAAAGGVVVAHRVARPLGTLAEAVEQMTAGNPEAPLEPSTVTEVARLSAAFRELRDRLAARTRESEQLATELRARAEALAESDRRKDEFLAMLAHELRNPLGAISNASYLMEQVGPAEPQMARSVAVVRRQTLHLSRMVDDLLDVSRITRGKVELRRQPIELRDALLHAVEATQPLLDERGHRLELSLSAEPLPLDADATRLEQVFGNLLRNAAKYTEPGGRIAVAAGREGDEAVVEVSDDGIGIAPEFLPRVFDLFTQAEQELDRTGAGLGIGLTLVRSLVEMHGGRVQAASDGPGRGSLFVVRLPLQSREAAPEPVSLERGAGSS